MKRTLLVSIFFAMPAFAQQQAIGPDACLDKLAEKEFKREEMPGVGTMVVCQVSGNQDNVPTCADVARVYAAAVAEAPERFGVSVQGARGASCDGTFARDGAFVEPLQRPRGSRPLPWDAPIERQ